MRGAIIAADVDAPAFSSTLAPCALDAIPSPLPLTPERTLEMDYGSPDLKQKACFWKSAEPLWRTPFNQHPMLSCRLRSVINTPAVGKPSLWRCSPVGESDINIDWEYLDPIAATYLSN